jgi:sporulation protein YlmC with PRC-barrel domain
VSAAMLVPFGTHVVDREGKSVGTVSRLVLGPLSEEVVALVVQQGVLNRREVVVPINKVADFGKEVRLSLRASELAGLDLFNAQPLKPMPDHWKMPLGFDQRSLFLIAGDGWTTAVLPFVLTSPRVSGTPAYIPDPDAHVDPEPAIAVKTSVLDNAGRQIGEVEGVEVDEASGRITRIIVRRGRLFHTETAIPASLIASVGDTITLDVSADEVKRLERALTDQLGTAPSRQRAG